MLKVWKTLAEIYMGSTIYYDVKSYQVKMTIVKFKKVQLKGLKFNLSQKSMLVWPTFMWRNKNLNNK